MSCRLDLHRRVIAGGLALRVSLGHGLLVCRGRRRGRWSDRMLGGSWGRRFAGRCFCGRGGGVVGKAKILLLIVFRGTAFLQGEAARGCRGCRELAGQVVRGGTGRRGRGCGRGRCRFRARVGGRGTGGAARESGGRTRIGLRGPTQGGVRGGPRERGRGEGRIGRGTGPQDLGHAGSTESTGEGRVRQQEARRLHDPQPPIAPSPPDGWQPQLHRPQWVATPRVRVRRSSTKRSRRRTRFQVRDKTALTDDP